MARHGRSAWSRPCWMAPGAVCSRDTRRKEEQRRGAARCSRRFEGLAAGQVERDEAQRPGVARQGTETACCETSGKGEGEEEGEESVVGQQPAVERETRAAPVPVPRRVQAQHQSRQADARAEGQAGLSLSLQRCRGRPAEAQREVQHRPPRNRRACAAASLRRPCHLARRGHVRAALPIAAPVLAVCCSCAGRRPCG